MNEPDDEERQYEARERAVAIIQHGPRPLISADVLTTENEQRKLLGEYVATHMKEGTDFGVIPGTQRPGAVANKTLLKPGAEKLTSLFRCVPQFTVEEKIENWETNLFFYRFTCRIVSMTTNAVVAEGVGSASSYESRYRWRQADRACPSCGAAAILRSKYPPRDNPTASPGWYCFAKKGGCGANFDADDPLIVMQHTGRVQNPDLADAANTVLKMAKKRAHVDAAITLARCSDIFTQDVEDFHDAPPTPVHQPPADAITQEQAAELEVMLRSMKATPRTVAGWLDVLNVPHGKPASLADLANIPKALFTRALGDLVTIRYEGAANG